MIVGATSNSGSVVNPETAMRLTAVYACVRVLSESIAQLPLIYYERTGNRKERAVAETLYTLLHDAPNQFQTSFEFRETKMAHLCLRGKAFLSSTDRALAEYLIAADASGSRQVNAA